MAAPRAGPSLMFRRSTSDRPDQHLDLATASGFRRSHSSESSDAAASRAGAPSCSPPSVSWLGGSFVWARGLLQLWRIGKGVLENPLSAGASADRPRPTPRPASLYSSRRTSASPEDVGIPRTPHGTRLLRRSGKRQQRPLELL